MSKFTIKSVINAVQKAGFKVVKFQRPDPLMDLDGEVSISETRHIQVGDSYVMVVDIEADETFYFSQEITTHAALIAELKKAA